MKRKIAFVVAIPGTAQAFLKDHMIALSKEYDISLIANFPTEESKDEFRNIGVKCINAPIQRQIKIIVNTNRWKWLDRFLIEMGKRSTSIWFIHTYFCYYLFHDFIYGFKFPILIFFVLLTCSYISAIVIDWINKHSIKLLLGTNNW